MLKAPSIPITLSIEDLLPDANGEIVIVSDGDNPQLSIISGLRVCDAGVARDHVTAEGIDVAGLSFYSFEGGVKLYYSADIDLTIAPPQG